MCSVVCSNTLRGARAVQVIPPCIPGAKGVVACVCVCVCVSVRVRAYFCVQTCTCAYWCGCMHVYMCLAVLHVYLTALTAQRRCSRAMRFSPLYARHDAEVCLP